MLKLKLRTSVKECTQEKESLGTKAPKLISRSFCCLPPCRISLFNYLLGRVAKILNCFLTWKWPMALLLLTTSKRKVFRKVEALALPFPGYIGCCHGLLSMHTSNRNSKKNPFVMHLCIYLSPLGLYSHRVKLRRALPFNKPYHVQAHLVWG